MRIVYLLLCLSLFSPLALAQPGIIETVAGDGNFVQSGDGGPATSAGLGSSHSVAVDASGNLYIGVNWPARVRRVAPDGIITTIAGIDELIGPGDTGDGGPAVDAFITWIADLAVEPTGNLLIATNNNVRRVNVTTGIITHVAGDDTPDFSGDGGLAVNAAMGLPTGLAVDGAGNIYVSDAVHSRVRRIDAATGLITTFAGTGNFGDSGDGGPATSADITSPYGLAIVDGSLYLTSGSTKIRGVDLSTGIISTVVDSIGVDARDLATAPIGVYTSQVNNHVVFRYDDSGAADVVAGTLGQQGFAGDGGLATDALLSSPVGIATDSTGRLYISVGTRVRRVTFLGETTTGLTSSVNPSVPGEPVTFTATVTSPEATGTVEFKDGAASLGTLTVLGGTAELTLSNLTSGNHSITAEYSGDFAFLGSTSAPVEQFVKSPSSISLASSPNPSLSGESISLTATVSPMEATGTVEFKDGAASLGVAPVSNGLAVLSVSSLAAGSHSLTADYSGDTTYAPSASAPLDHVVQIATTLSVAQPTDPAITGQPVTLSATVTPSAATGTVEFFEGAVSLGSAALSGGQAAIVTTFSSNGAHDIHAVYSGDTAHAGSTSPQLTVVVKTVTSLSLAANPSSSVFGTPVTLTATLTPGGTGSIDFFDGAAPIGSATISSGQAILVTTSLSSRSHSIQAVYGGDSGHLGSTSAAAGVTVTAADTTTSLTITPTVANQGQPVEFRADIAPATAAGTVEFRKGSTVLGSASVSGGVGIFVTSSLSKGNYKVRAHYLGDGNHSASVSLQVMLRVKK